MCVCVDIHIYIYIYIYIHTEYNYVYPIWVIIPIDLYFFGPLNAPEYHNVCGHGMSLMTQPGVIHPGGILFG